MEHAKSAFHPDRFNFALRPLHTQEINRQRRRQTSPPMQSGSGYFSAYSCKTMCHSRPCGFRTCCTNSPRGAIEVGAVFYSQYAGPWREVFKSDVYDALGQPDCGRQRGSINVSGPPLHGFQASGKHSYPRQRLGRIRTNLSSGGAGSFLS